MREYYLLMKPVNKKCIDLESEPLSQYILTNILPKYSGNSVSDWDYWNVVNNYTDTSEWEADGFLLVQCLLWIVVTSVNRNLLYPIYEVS